MKCDVGCVMEMGLGEDPSACSMAMAQDPWMSRHQTGKKSVSQNPIM